MYILGMCLLGRPGEVDPLEITGIPSQVGIEEGCVSKGWTPEPLVSLCSRFFFTYLLPHSAPPALRPLLDSIVNATGELSGAHLLPITVPLPQQVWGQEWPRAAQGPGTIISQSGLLW